MKILLSIAALCLPGLAAAADPLLTPERTAVLQRLQQNGHPWLKFTADFARGDYGPYGNIGQWDTLLWKAGAGERHARAAAEKLVAAARSHKNTGDRNSTRESGSFFALHYMWLKPVMTEAERAEVEAMLRWWAQGMLERGQAGIKTLSPDSDEVIGHYFALRLIDRALGSDYATQPAAGDSIDGPRMRQRIRDFCTMAKGGEWIESSEYNLGTLQLLLIGSAAVGIEEFPEVQALLPELAEQLRWHLTPDLADSVQWGDEQEPHSLHLHNRVAVMAMVIGLGGDRDGKLAPLLAKLTDRPIYPGYWHQLYRGLWFIDPAALPIITTTGENIGEVGRIIGEKGQFITEDGKFIPAPQGLRVAAGQGLAIYRRPDVLLQIHFPNTPRPSFVDHGVPYFGDVRLWSGGEWVIDHPIGYGAPSQACNVGLLSGLGCMEDRGIVSADETAEGCRIVGRTKGPRHLPPYWDPPPAFADWTREVSFDKSVLKVTDRFTGTPPARIDRYHPPEQAELRAALGLWTQVWHAPSEPAETADGFTWQTAKGQRVRLMTSAAKRLKRRDELGVTLGGSFHPEETRGWQIACVSDEPQAVIETSVLIGDAPLPEPPPVDPLPDARPLLELLQRATIRQRDGGIEIFVPGR